MHRAQPSTAKTGHGWRDLKIGKTVLEGLQEDIYTGFIKRAFQITFPDTWCCPLLADPEGRFSRERSKTNGRGIDTWGTGILGQETKDRDSGIFLVSPSRNANQLRLELSGRNSWNGLMTRQWQPIALEGAATSPHGRSLREPQPLVSCVASSDEKAELSSFGRGSCIGPRANWALAAGPRVRPLSRSIFPRFPTCFRWSMHHTTPQPFGCSLICDRQGKKCAKSLNVGRHAPNPSTMVKMA